MQPHERRKTAKASGLARARMLLKAHLGWLTGYPVEPSRARAVSSTSGSGTLLWQPLDARGASMPVLTITRTHLSRATRTVSELARDYPEALADVVGDVDAWRRKVATILDALKPTLHAGAPTPCATEVLSPCFSPRAWRTALASVPRVGPLSALVDSMVWASALEADGSALETRLAAIGKLERELSALPTSEGHGSELLVLLVLVAHDVGVALVRPLASLLADPRISQSPTAPGDYAASIARRYRRVRGPLPEAPSRPTSDLRPALTAWVTWLSNQDHGTRRRALVLFGYLDAERSIASWARWWKRVDVAEHEAKRALAAATRNRPWNEAIAKIHRRARTLVAAAPPPLSGDTTLSLLSYHASPSNEACASQIEAALRDLDPGVQALDWLSHWRTLIECEASRAFETIREFRTYLSKTAALGSRRLAPWSRVLDARRAATPQRRIQEARRAAGLAHFEDSFEYVLVLHAEGPAEIARFFAALAHAALSDVGPLDAFQVDALARLAPADAAPETLVALARSATVAAMSLYSIDAPTVQHAVRLAKGDLVVAEGLVEACDGLSSYQEGRALLRALDPFFASGRGDLALAFLDQGLAARLVACARSALWRPPPWIVARRPSDADASWIASYPRGLARVLGDLDALAPSGDGAVIAARLLRRALPSREALATEIATAREKLDTLSGNRRERLATRIANLEQRAAAPSCASLTPARVGRLEARLTRAVATAAIERMELDARAIYEQPLRAALGVEMLPDLLTTPRARRLLAPIPELTPGMRALAMRLFKARLRPPPWDLRDDPANVAFARSVAALGIDLTPWIDGMGRVAMRAKNGAELTLWLEDDPLSIFEMGGHFDTCLTPGNYNYFSVFANGADINKRVLYAADGAGRIVGRCLLGLTRQGALVTFHPYAHRTEVDFPGLVRAFTTTLTAAMGTVVVPRGDVPRLVAPDWYDDGPVDLGGNFAFLADGSPFRAGLATIAPDDLASALDALVAPLPLNELTLPPILELPELTARPELVLSLLPRLRALPALSGASVLRAARLALAASASSHVALVRAPDLVRRVEAALRDGHRREDGTDPSDYACLIDLDPSRGLALLRATRRQGVRAWRDEPAFRLELAARAHERLHRPSQAIALYRLAIASHVAGSYDPDLKRRCAYRVRVLLAERDTGPERASL